MTSSDKQAQFDIDYKKRMKTKGFVQVRIWIPKTEVVRVMAFCRGLRGIGK